jgi:hypothetical protein
MNTRRQETCAPTLVDCGCEARVHADGSGIEISYCPLHDEAENIASALRRALEFIGTDPRYTSQGHTGAADILNRGRLALRKAGEE